MEGILEKAKADGVRAEVTTVDTEVVPLRFESGKLMDVNARNIRETALRVIKDGRLGTVEGTGSTDGEKLYEAATFSAGFGERIDVAFPTESIVSEEFVDPAVLQMTPDEQFDFSRGIIRRIGQRNDKIPVDLTVTRETQTVNIANTEGLASRYKKTAFRVWIQGRVPGSKVGIIKESAKTKFHDVPDELLDELDTQFRALDRTLGVRSGPMPVIFTQAAAWSLLYRFYAGANGENVARGISPLCGKIGERIAPDLFTLHDDPFFSDNVEARPFDDEGVRVSAKPVIEAGILKGYLHDLKSAAKMKAAPTGNGFRFSTWTQGIQFAPNPQFASMVCLGGDSSLEAMIAAVDYGVIVDYVLGFHSGNITNGDYSMNVGVGFLVKKGKVEGRVMDAMVAGNVYRDFPNLVAVSRRVDKSFKGYCPALMFKELKVAGKE